MLPAADIPSAAGTATDEGYGNALDVLLDGLDRSDIKPAGA